MLAVVANLFLPQEARDGSERPSFRQASCHAPPSQVPPNIGFGHSVKKEGPYIEASLRPQC